MKSLENFIRENREAFDSQTPDLRVWAAIDQHLSEGQHKTHPKVIRMPFFANKMRIAASIIGILVSGIAIGFFMKANQKVDELAAISPEYGEMERYYQQQIDKKTKQLVSYSNIDNVKADLNQIDAVMEELRNELTNAPKGSREQIIRNMIASYKNKVGILERVIEEKNSHNHFVQTNNNTSNNEKDSI